MAQCLNILPPSEPQEAYFTFKNKFQRAIARVPKIGGQINRFVTMVNSKDKKSIYHNATFFEDMGFRYYGPIDGHDYEDLIPVLNAAKFHTHSVLIHVNTVKGMGYNPAEKNPTKFHGIGKFDIETGEPKTSGETFLQPLVKQFVIWLKTTAEFAA